ncbi:MAG: 4-alpha-glucanotransferase [Rikenellaceae bacterium]|nr:4-alpha-glucanotransferase [Rikenellaceae bacterium]
MKASLRLHYCTEEGAKLQVVPVEGKAINMNDEGDGFWSAEIELHSNRPFRYSYRVVRGRQIVRSEWGEGHSLTEIAGVAAVEVLEHWCDEPESRLLHSSMFRHRLLSRAIEPQPLMVGATHYVEVEAVLPSTERVALIGSTKGLGEWDTAKALPMRYLGNYRWGITLCEREYAEYKFVVVDANNNFLRWERGENRVLRPSDKLHLTLGLRLRDSVQWRGAGVAVPVFSLRSEQGFGVGEFADLQLLGDWCAKTGQRIIQILPVNDTSMTMSWQDSYPYNAVSSFALHPLYIRLSDVGYLRGEADRAEMESLQAELNALPDLDYERVIKAKIKYLRKMYEQLGARCMESKSFRDFEKRNREWLMPYAVFSVLRDKYGTANFEEWKTFTKYAEKRCAAFAERNEKEVGFYYYMQYHLDRQLRKVRDYLHSKGVVLKGDIPIGVSRTSVDVWQNPELFDVRSSAGAPPDAFSAEGQNWGFPIYNWEKMAESDYAWWRARFEKMTDYFDAYRIDHILGFFRIWAVPEGAKNALLGAFVPSLPYSASDIRSEGFNFEEEYDVARDLRDDNVLWLAYGEGFVPRITPFDTEAFKSLPRSQQEAFVRLHDNFYYKRHNTFWGMTGAERLRALTASTQMLACGEDLGMIPSCVPQVMREEQILSLEIERMPKEYGLRVGDVMRNPYLSVCTTSTHDMSPLRLWWRDEAERQYYFEKILGEEGVAPAEATAELCEKIVARHLASPSMLTILPLQDWLSLSEELRSDDIERERINIPAVAHHYWRYRLNLSLEKLVGTNGFNAKISDLITKSRR